MRGYAGERDELGLAPASADNLPDDLDSDAAPPPQLAADERRMQVRAYNFWAGMLGTSALPLAAPLLAGHLPDFADHSVLLHFDTGLEDPAIAYVGESLLADCAAAGPMHRLSDVPGRSILSRITDHYLQIVANEAPIGFEAEFSNQNGSTILYRGILLPFSSDGTALDYIYGVINWKELADQATTDELLAEIGQVLEAKKPRRKGGQLAEAPAHVPPVMPMPAFADPDDEDGQSPDRLAASLGHWADGPLRGSERALRPADQADILDLSLPGPGTLDLIELDLAELDLAEIALEILPALDGGLAEGLVEPEPDSLADWLACARAMAELALGSEDRTRQALYGAIGRAWDFALAAEAEPEDFAELLADAGLTVQARAPLIPVVKLVFGAGYDKTRLTEYATALAHAHRLGLSRGELAGFLTQTPGGLKGVVAAERRLRRAEEGQARIDPRAALEAALRTLPARDLADIAPEGREFSLVMVRRMPGGSLAVLGEVIDDEPLLERAARRLVH